MFVQLSDDSISNRTKPALSSLTEVLITSNCHNFCQNSTINITRARLCNAVVWDQDTAHFITSSRLNNATGLPAEQRPPLPTRASCPSGSWVWASLRWSQDKRVMLLSEPTPLKHSQLRVNWKEERNTSTFRNFTGASVLITTEPSATTTHTSILWLSL